jgi:hypothetical protein
MGREPSRAARYVRRCDPLPPPGPILTAETKPAAGPTAADAELAVARLEELSADLRGCAVLGADGAVLAASGDPEAWTDAANDFLAAVDGAASGPAAHAHVATEDGEAFAVRHGELVMVAVTDRFTLASLVVTDMRMALRDLGSGEAGRDRRAPERAPTTPDADDEQAHDPTEGMD